MNANYKFLESLGVMTLLKTVSRIAGMMTLFWWALWHF